MKTTKKIGGLFTFAFVALLGATAHAEDLAWLDQPLKKPLSEVVIGITQYNAGVDSYQTVYEQAAKDYAKAIGIRAIVLDPQGDPARQISQMQNLITQKVDAMVVWPTNPKAVVTQVCRAHKLGMPIVVTDTQVDASGQDCIDSFVGFDTVKEGRIAGEILVKALEGQGNVVVINGVPGYVNSTNREQGFLSAIKDHPQIKVIDAQPADWNREKAQRLMENYITKYGKTIQGVFASDDNMGAGALTAIKAAGFKPGEIKVVGATNFAAGYDAIKTGEFAGSVVQSPYLEARETVRAAVRLALGQKVEKVNFIDTPALLQSNIDEMPRPVF